jgi:SAM-dependent methyltransferase
MDQYVEMAESDRKSGFPCPICGGCHLIDLALIEGVPLFCNQVMRDREAALSIPRGDIWLAGCPVCGHVFNRAFDPELMNYAAEYENSLHVSGHYQAYADETVRRLVTRCGLKGRKVAEIGSGRGEFLVLLCRTARCSGVGYDPSQPTATIMEEVSPDGTMSRVDLVGRYFLPEDATSADFICSRHVMEHLPKPLDLLIAVSNSARPNTMFFLEVPNGLFTIERLGIWDLIYEHFSYFTPDSLAHALARAGITASHIETAFGGQFLWAEARLGNPGEVPAAAPTLVESLRRFPIRHAAVVRRWTGLISDLLAEGKRIVVWGAGSKGVTFLNILGLRSGCGIDWVVDINVRKAGAFVAGTGQEIVPPERLVTIDPDAIVVMNPEYRDEIAQKVEDLGLECSLIIVTDSTAT